MLVQVGKKGQSRRADRVNEWAVLVRLNDGRELFWSGGEGEGPGQEWGHVNKAFRFETEKEAGRYAASCALNNQAWEYRAVRLPQPL